MFDDEDSNNIDPCPEIEESSLKRFQNEINSTIMLLLINRKFLKSYTKCNLIFEFWFFSVELKKNTIFSKKISFKGFPCNSKFFRFNPLIKIDIIQNQKKRCSRDCRELNSLKNDAFEILYRFYKNR